MTQSEEYFPRGKATPEEANGDSPHSVETEDSCEKKLKRKSKLENLFADKKKPKPEVKDKTKKSKHALTPEETKALGGGKRKAEEKRFSVVPLSYDQIVEGMLSLGIVTKVTDHEVFVTLPGRVIGTVSITEVSTPYVKFIEKHAQNKGDKNENVVFYTLKEMFYIGQSVVVKVKHVERLETRVKIALSMNPSEIYANYSTTVLKRDLVMIAAVVSEEDHGYVMDIGINGARCFLSRDDANKFTSRGNFNRPLGIGQLVYSKINNLKVHRLIADVKLTAFVKAVKSQKMDDFIGLNYSTLIPGMLVDVIVMETHKTGLMGHTLDFNGLIHQDQMKDEWTSPESLEVGAIVPGRILYILPNLTTPYLTLQTDMVPMSYIGDRTNRDKLGSKEKVRVLKTEKRGLQVRIEDGGYKGLVPLFHLGDETLLTAEDISKRFKDNSVHEARILKYSPIERMYICSFKKNLLESDIVHPERAVGGVKVTCQILQWNKGGAMVTYGAGMRGFIPNTLFRPEKVSDATKENLVGSTHKARIFSRDPEKERVVLTVRKELVKSKGVVISSIEEAQVGMIGHAIIQSFNNVGAYVRTIGGCEGFIPASKLTDEPLKNFKDAFHLNQIVEYKVLEINEEKNHLVLSLRLNDEPEEKKKPKRGKKRPLETSSTSVKDASAAVDDGDSAPPRKKKNRRKLKKSKKSKETRTVQKSIGSTQSDEEEELHPVEKPKEEDGLQVPESTNFWDTSLNTFAKDASGDSDEPDSENHGQNEPTKKTSKKQDKLERETLKVSVPLSLVTGTKDNCLSKTTLSLEAIEKFERGIISEPNDPAFWTGLMTHYTFIGMFDKARAVARQALDMISFRDETAKLKVWGAWFKLEVKFGTEDSIKTTLADALQRNDPFECLKLMALVYDGLDRFKDAEKTYRQIVKQFRLEPEAWIRFGTFYYQRKKSDSGRELLNEALTALPFSKHVFLISKFALLELHHGEKGKGESMYDQILSQTKNQQRADIWLQFINALIKAGEYEKTRAVFNRAFQLKWHPKKVKPLLKRFLEFETAHGTEETRKEFQSVALKVLDFSQTEAVN